MSGFFLDPEETDEEGLVAVGGSLSVSRLLEAYGSGIFPFYNDELPILWWSPDPRAIFEIGEMHISRRLARTLRSQKFSTTFDRAFVEVMHGCADRPGEGTWILPEMIAAYTQLHEQGDAHSVEVWHNGELAGGVYGVTVGAVFAGESMFTRVRDASKVALVHLMQRLQERQFQLFDIQYLNDHTESLGAIEISRRDYLRRLRRAVKANVKFVDV